MSETKRKLRNSKETDLTELSEGAFVALNLRKRRHSGLVSTSAWMYTTAYQNHQLTPVCDLNSCVGQNNLLGQSNIFYHELYPDLCSLEVYVFVFQQISRYAAGPDSKKRRSPAGKGAQRQSNGAGEGLVQATVEDVAATSASASGAKLVDPNTGKEVNMPSGGSKKLVSTKPAKAKTSKTGQLVSPNTGEKVEASSTVESKPASKSRSSKQVQEGQSSDDKAGASTSDKDQPVQINRAPVLTLWVAVVAKRQGFSKEAGLTFGKAISGMLAQSKGRCDTLPASSL